MTVVDAGLAAIAALLGNSGTVPTHTAIGTGSDIVLTNDTTLLSESDRNGFTSTDLSLTKNVTFVGDFSSTEISGLTFQEFGVFNSGAGGDMFHREVVGSITFIGDRELQVQSTFRFVRP